MRRPGRFLRAAAAGEAVQEAGLHRLRHGRRRQVRLALMAEQGALALDRRKFLQSLGAGTVAMAAAKWLGAAEARPARPNVLLVLADDMGFSDAGCYGGEIETPNLDRLARGGVRFSQFYNTARCWPTRCCLLTGYWEQQTRRPFQPWVRTLPHDLKPAGYRCYHSGKWHVQGAPHPMRDGGFDATIGANENQYFTPGGPRDGASGPDAGLRYQTDVLADHAIACLKDHARLHGDKPFFSYLAFHAPHFPLHALQDDIARYRDRYLVGWDAVRQERLRRQRQMGIVNCGLSALEGRIRAPSGKPADIVALGPGEIDHAVPWKDLSDEQRRFQATKMAIHAAMVDRIDRQMGRVMDQVRAMGQFDNTVILFASDNGASAEIMIRGGGHDPSAPPGSSKTFLCLGPGWSSASNTPFRRHKIWVHEGGVSTPLVVHWPKGMAARGELRHDVGHVVDVPPTVLDLAHARHEPPAGAPPLAGQSLVPAFARDGAATREFVYFNHAGNRALRMGRWKAVSAKMDGDDWELYDLAADRCEQVNLAARDPDRLRSLTRRWTELDEQFAREASGQGRGRV
jgi:arylsulfatase